MKNKDALIIWVSCLAFFVMMAAFTGLNKMMIIPGIGLTGLIFVKRKRISLAYIFNPEKETAGYTVAAFVAMIPMMIYFVKQCRKQGIFNSFVAKINLSADVAGYVAALAVAVCAFPFLLYSIKYICREFLGFDRDSLKKCAFMIRPSLILSAILCLSIITIIRANFIYKDDMQRIVNGATIYTREGRYLAEYIMCFLEMDEFFADISPVPQLLGMIIMAVSSVMLWHLLTGRKKAGFFDIIAMLSLTLTPYFLEGVSFKYDSPQHAVATFFAILPLCFRNRGTVKYIIAVAASSILLCCFHQAPMGLFPSLVIALAFTDWNRKRVPNRENLRFAAKSASGYIIGMLIYRFVLMKDIKRTSLDGVAVSASSIFSPGRLIPGVIKNYRTFFSLVLQDFEPLWTVLILLICIGFIVISVRCSSQSRKAAIAGTAAAFLMLLALSFGTYPLLETPLLSPRHLFSICYFVGIVTIMTICIYDVHVIIPKAAAVTLVICFFSFSLKYGNALYYQGQYTGFRTEEVVSELAKLDLFEEYDKANLLITGDVGYCSEIKQMDSNMINKLTPTMFSEYFGCWYAAGVYNRYGLRVLYPSDPSSLDRNEMECVSDTYYHTIYVKDDNILVDLKERNDCLWVE